LSPGEENDPPEKEGVKGLKWTFNVVLAVAGKEEENEKARYIRKRK